MHRIVVFFCLSLAVTISAADTTRLYVVNALSENVSVIDMIHDTVVGQIPLGVQGYHLTVPANGKLAYVTAAPDPTAPGRAGVPTGQLVVIDLLKNSVVKRITLDISPLATVHLHPRGQLAYVVTAAAPGLRNTQRGRVLFVDLAHGTVRRTVAVGLNPLDSVMTPDGARLYTIDWASRSISVVDLLGERLQDTIPLGSHAARALAITPDGGKIYTVLEPSPAAVGASDPYMNSTQGIRNNSPLQQAALGNETTLMEINTHTGAIGRYPLPALTPVNALTLSPDGTRMFLYGQATSDSSNQAAGAEYSLVVFDVRLKKVIGRWGNFGYLAAMALNPSGSKLYLVGTPGNYTLETRAQDNYSRNAGARGPQGAMNNTIQQANTLNYTINDLRKIAKTVTVLDTLSGKKQKSLTVGSLPQSAVVVGGGKYK